LPEKPVFQPFSKDLAAIYLNTSAPATLQHDLEAVNSLNKRVLDKLQLGGEVFLSSTVIDGKFWLRACLINPRAAQEDMKKIVAVVKSRV
jgi:hypothetical protein